MNKEYILYHLQQRITGLKDWNEQLLKQVKDNKDLIRRTEKVIIELQQEESVNNINTDYEQAN